MFSYITEIKNRAFLVLMLACSCFVVLYIYKETILFLIIKNFQRSYFVISNFNFLSTDITEIFLIYISLIKFFSLQMICLFCFYNTFVFFVPALYKIEYFILKKFFFNLILIWFGSFILNNYVLVPLLWEFFFSFQSIHYYSLLDFYFEAKISSYLSFYKAVYFICLLYTACFLIMLTIFSFVVNKFLFIKKYRKVYYYFFFIISTSISPHN